MRIRPGTGPPRDELAGGGRCAVRCVPIANGACRRIARRAGRAGTAASACMLAFPKFVRVIFADPATVLATSASHAVNFNIFPC
jgi:hypothetical protein